MISRHSCKICSEAVPSHLHHLKSNTGKTPKKLPNANNVASSNNTLNLLETEKTGSKAGRLTNTTTSSNQSKTSTRTAVETMIDAIDTGYRLSTTTLKYYFWTSSDTGLVASTYLESMSKRTWTDDQKTSARRAFSEWEKISAFTFTETTTKSEAFFKVVLLDDSSYSYLGEARFPTTLGEGEVYMSYNNAYDKNFTVGSYDYITIIHELGHALGLAHPHDNGGTSGVFPGVTSPWVMGTNNQNQTVYTVMSYNDIGGSITPDTVQSYGFVNGPMAYDIAAIQDMYPLAESLNINSDNTTYEIPANGDNASFVAIVDTGGVDTISAEGSSSDVQIDLRAATLDGTSTGGGGLSKTISGKNGGFIVSGGAVIENAIGGAGNDIIIGNSSDNTVIGGAGRNVLFTGDGNDIIITTGTDAVHGGNGNDVIYASGKGIKHIYGGRGRDIINLPGRLRNYRVYNKRRNGVYFTPYGRAKRYTGIVVVHDMEYVKFYRERRRHTIRRIARRR